jgi:hypothetical protein
MSDNKDYKLTEIINADAFDFNHPLWQEAMRDFYRWRQQIQYNNAPRWGRKKIIDAPWMIELAKSIHKAREDGNKWEVVKAMVNAEHGKNYSVSHLSHILKQNKDKI